MSTSSESLKARCDQIALEASEFPLDLIARLVGIVTANAMLKVPSEAEVRHDGVTKFTQQLMSVASRIASELPAPNPTSARQVIKALQLKKGLTGPERALGAAIKLYHEHKPVNTARAINISSDECKGEFIISNITTAISAAVREGHLEVVEDVDPSTYKVTRHGFAYFDLKIEKLKIQFPAHFTGQDDETTS